MRHYTQKHREEEALVFLSLRSLFATEDLFAPEDLFADLFTPETFLRT